MSSGEEEIDGKPIGELRVIDLKELLDKRGLSKTGSKTALVKRLRESCGSDLVAEYLEKQQIALQAAKKAAGNVS
ncbi:unnamed protein product [Soboliphyme baturini]|uniref:SAP domain-containing protein n=1 Tax=Soboliphyme baturini TaxID=241478 RepID=A0A183J1L0_9BILA|nr:unnamed protein product [Soboliphyme baturini]